MNFTTTFIANSQPAKLVQPRQRSFNNPTVSAQAAAVFGPASGQHCFYANLVQNLSVRSRIICTVTLNTVRTLQRSSAFACNWRNSFNQGQKLRDIVTISSGEFYSQRRAASICNHVMFRPQFPSIRCIRARFRPPKTARTDAESTTALVKSIWSACLSLLSRTRCILSHTPAFCQSRSFRQQVMPEPQPISLGRYSHGMPVRRTNNMPVKAARSQIGFRPGYRKRLRFLGINGSIKFHNSSSNNGLAMSNLLVFRLLMLSCKTVNKLSFC